MAKEVVLSSKNLNTYTNYQDIDYHALGKVGGVIALAGLVTTLMFTCILASVSGGFARATDPVLYKIFYGISGSALGFGLIPLAIWSCKKCQQSRVSVPAPQTPTNLSAYVDL